VRQAEPWRLNHPAFIHYSTALWQLRQDAALGVLAHTMVEHLPYSPVTLAVVGNGYSLARDAKTAVTLFTRAVELDPTLAYAHTLRGYELLSRELPGDAEQAFREALRYDLRHYSAHAGLGELHCRLENDAKARAYFQAALDINPLPTILNRLAVTYHRPGATPADLRMALNIYNRTLQRAPGNFTAQHQRATLLMRLRQFDQALAELTKLAEECPDEAQVHITLGTCLAKAGQTTKAIHHLNRATDLDSRRTAFVRSCLERITAGNFDEDDE